MYFIKTKIKQHLEIAQLKKNFKNIKTIGMSNELINLILLMDASPTVKPTM